MDCPYLRICSQAISFNGVLSCMVDENDCKRKEYYDERRGRTPLFVISNDKEPRITNRDSRQYLEVVGE